MTDAARERQSRRMMVAIMISALALYLGYKTYHVSIALGAWEGQRIVGDTSGAAK
ncbi:MAG: hypothetical protein AAGH68_06480 [Pseudomonadota bacterium]